MSAGSAAKRSKLSILLLATITLALALVLACVQSASASVITGSPNLVITGQSVNQFSTNAVNHSTGNPTSNRQLSATTNQACEINQLSAQCQIDVLVDIDAARAAEGVPPMVLPPDYESLTVPQQLLVLANLERTGRGLIPAEGLSASLDVTASVAALADVDPDPSIFHGSELTANWAGGTPSPLIADFLWMYDDGLGSGNLDCTPANQSGCWGHREDTLYPFSAPLVMGAAYQPNTLDGPSLAELFVGGDTATAVGDVDAILAPTWATISQTLQDILSATSIRLTGGTPSGQLQITAPASGMYVTAHVTRGTGSWRVSPSSCLLSPGASCTLTVTGQPGTSGSLVVSGPAGVQTLALTSQSTATLSMRVGKARGSSVTVTGRLADVNGRGVSGQLVTLMRHTQGAVTTSVVARARTRSGGMVSFRVSPHISTQYLLRFGGTATLAAASSSPSTADAVRR